jgi:hypothetical protein
VYLIIVWRSGRDCTFYHEESEFLEIGVCHPFFHTEKARKAIKKRDLAVSARLDYAG